MKSGPSLASPEISVIIPTHNRPALLRQALHSVLWQKDVDFEVIVVDDGSTGDTLRFLAGLSDDRVRIVRHEVPQGVSAARNHGVDQARGKWIAFIDDDDLWAPEKLARQLKAARDSGRTWAYTGAVNVTMSLRVVGGAPLQSPEEVMRRLPELNIVPGGASGVIASKKVLMESGLFDTRLQPMADWDMWIRLARSGPPACVELPLVAYRLHTHNMSLDTARVEAEFEVVAGRTGKGNHAVLYRYLGWLCGRARRRVAAIRYFVRAALRRDAEYAPRAFLADLSYLTIDAADDLRRRFASRLLRRSLRRSLHRFPSQYEDWRDAGQDWVDSLQAEMRSSEAGH
jgi:glycosyltransferase involved in cell wall biosynthesis